MKSLLILPVLVAVISAGLGTGPGPYLQAALYEAANQHPNATGTKPILGTNMTLSPFEGQAEEWTASINVTEVAGDTTAPSGEVVTNTILALNSNGNFVEGDSANFQTCVVIMTGVSRDATVKGQDDQGLCVQAFGQDCVADWTSAISRARAQAQSRNETSSNGGCGGIDTPPLPATCEGSFTTDFFAYNIDRLNQTMGYPIFYSTSVPHKASNLNSYDEAVTKLWPLVLIQSPAQKFADRAGGGLYSAQMSCLRAGNISEGSHKATGVPGASSRVQVDIWSVLSVATVMAVLF